MTKGLFWTIINRQKVKNSRIRKAAEALIADVRQRYPGEELRCKYMRELDHALRGIPVDECGA